MKLQYTLLLAVGLASLPALAQNPTRPAMVPPPQAAPTEPDMSKVNVALGLYFGNNASNTIKNYFPDANVDEVVKNMKMVLEGKPVGMTDQEAGATLQNAAAYFKAKVGERNKKAGEEFLTKNAQEPGVKTLPSGLQYLVLTEGTGATPKATDTVVVNYKGTLLDGTEFDSSYKRGQPAEFPVGGVVPGWQEALQLMKVGSKWKVFIPANLAYGEQGNRGIPGNSVLIFEMELLSIKEPPKDTNQGGVSGEIIKVPSAEEMKKGAQIEVIKPGQTNTVPVK